MLLTCARRSQVFSRWTRDRLRPQCFAVLAALGRTRAVQRQPERDAHQPSAKTGALAQTTELPVSAEQSFLRYVFCVGGVPQDAARDSKRQGAALRQPLLEFAAKGCARCFACPLSFGRTAWLGQNQLLHSCVRAKRARPPRTATRRCDA